MVLIPCYNEEKGIEKVIKSFPTEKLERHGYSLNIVVIDNNSTDKTADIARSLGATVIHEKSKGKGNAIKCGFRFVDNDTDYVVMLDGDNTYRPEELHRLVEPLDSGFCDVIIGSRLQGKISDNSMKLFNRIGNWFYSFIVRFFYKVNVTDVLTGYFAWKRSVVKELHPHLYSDGFAIEMEMITKMAKLDYTIYSVPISYHEREGQSNLSPISDGYRILKMFVKNIFWKPPMNAGTVIRPSFVTREE